MDKAKQIRWQSVLHHAAGKGCHALVKVLLDGYICREWSDFEGNLAVHVAVLNGHKQVVETLLHSVDVASCRGANGWTPMHLAAVGSNIEMLKTMLSLTTKRGLKDLEEKTPLHLAAAAHDSRDIIAILLDNNEDINARDKRLRTPLHLAAGTGHINVLNLLLEQGADVTAVDIDGRTPLHYAASEDHKAVALVLLEKTGDNLPVDNAGQSPITCAGHRGHLELAFLLFHLSYQYEPTYLRGFRAVHGWPASSQFPKTSTSLLDGSLFVDERNALGETPLITAARTGHLLLVNVLLDRLHGDVDAKCNSGTHCTALHTAVVAGQQDIVETLLRRGANPEIENSQGSTALHLATNGQLANHITIVRVLVKERAELEARDIYNRTPLHIAAIRGNQTIVDILLNHGAQLEASGNRNRTALHFAAMNRRTVVLRTLLERGANPDPQIDLARSTPLHIAVEKKFRAGVNVLLLGGAKVEAENSLQRTAIHLAVLHNRPSILALLLKHYSLLDKEDEFGRTALHYAVSMRSISSVTKLVTYVQSISQITAMIRMAGANGHVDIASVLFQRACELWDSGELSNYPNLFQWSVRSGASELLLPLLAIDPSQLKEKVRGITPLMAAAKTRQAEVLEILILQGANSAEKGPEGETAMHYACRAGCERAVKVLLMSNLNATTTDRQTPFHWAARGGNPEVFALLFPRGSVLAEDCLRRSVIHHCADAGHVDLLKWLLDRYPPLLHKEDANYWTALHYAASNGHIETSRELVKRGAILYPPTRANKAPLQLAASCAHVETVHLLFPLTVQPAIPRENKVVHWALRNGYTQLVKALLDGGIDTNEKDVFGNTLLISAIRCRNGDVIVELLDRHVDLEVPDAEGMTALHVAVILNDLGNALNVLSAGSNTEARAKHGKTSLHLASQDERATSVLEALLEWKADINSKDDMSRTALHDAAMKGSTTAVDRLLENGADRDARDDQGITPLHDAVSNGHVAIVEKMLRAGSNAEAQANNGWTPLHVASKKGLIAVMEALLKANANPDAVAANLNSTPLHIAAEAAQEESVTVLLDSGAQIEASDLVGRSVLQYSAIAGHLNVVRLLSARGAKLDATDLASKTALHHCALQGHTEIGRFLIDRGVNIQAEDARNQTPLHHAASRGRVGITALLLTMNPDLEVRDRDGRTALHLAAAKGFVEIIKLLLGKGANISAVDITKWTPLHFAARKGQDDVAALLVDHGADIDARCNEDKTPLQHATEKCQKAVENILECIAELRRRSRCSKDVNWDDQLRELGTRFSSVKRQEDILPFFIWLKTTFPPRDSRVESLADRIIADGEITKSSCRKFILIYHPDHNDKMGIVWYDTCTVITKVDDKRGFLIIVVGIELDSRKYKIQIVIRSWATKGNKR